MILEKEKTEISSLFLLFEKGLIFQIAYIFILLSFS